MLKINISDGVKVNDAKAIAPDVEADNGVIHIINTVVIGSISVLQKAFFLL